MKKSRFTDSQIIAVLKQGRAGAVPRAQHHSRRAYSLSLRRPVG